VRVARRTNSKWIQLLQDITQCKSRLYGGDHAYPDPGKARWTLLSIYLNQQKINRKHLPTLGKNVTSYKMAAFVIGAALASIGGGLYAMYISYIDPSSFTVMESIIILSIVIIGGAGSLTGSIAGSPFLLLSRKSSA
jgi:hypothetical protein